MARTILRETHVEACNPGDQPNAKGCVVCCHTSRHLDERELELVRVAVDATLQALFTQVIK